MGDASTPENPIRPHDKMPQRGWIVTVTLVAAVLILAVAAFLAWQAARLPFPGFLAEPTYNPIESGDPDWPYKTSTVYLIEFAGQPMVNTFSLVEALQAHRIGD